MTRHFDPSAALSAPIDAGRRTRGKRAYLSGAAAEDSVARHYVKAGARVLARRWRGKAGEIDLILHDAGTLVFVEVKSSRVPGRAMAAIRPPQIARICTAAQEFAGDQPDGLLSDMRFDVATVDGRGQVTVLENAFGEF